jgi:hypothetical protein
MQFFQEIMTKDHFADFKQQFRGILNTSVRNYYENTRLSFEQHSFSDTTLLSCRPEFVFHLCYCSMIRT